MPATTSDKPQQPITNGFSGANLYTNHSIWHNSFAASRDRSINANASTDAYAPADRRHHGSHVPTRPAEADDTNPTGSSALNANSEAVGWNSNPWNTTTATTTTTLHTSPNRTRDGAIPNGAAFFDNNHASIGMKKTGYEPNGYGVSFGQQKRSPQEATFMDKMTGFPAAREHSAPPSRQSQGSPGYQELFSGHAHSNSASHRHMHQASASFSAQSANHRAYNMNKSLDDELALQYGRQMALDSAANTASAFNPASQPFQLNPASQPRDTNSQIPDNTFELGVDSLVASLKRQSIDRITPSSGYRMDPGNSNARTYAPAPDPWAARPPSRDPRVADLTRQVQVQQFPAGFNPAFFPTQYAFPNLPPQYAHNFMDAYGQPYRHQLLPNYGMAPIHAGYPLASPLAPIRPSRDQDPSKGMRSALLDEFRVSNKSSKRFELKDIYGHVVEFSGDQHGSRFIQQKLETANSDEKDQLFREIEPNAIQLMKDVFGNYVVQKFFEHGNQVQKKVLAERMKGKVVDLSVQVYACRVVQKAFEHVLVEQQAQLTKELEADILRVIRDQNGNHVVQKIIELVPRQYIDFIMAALRGNVIGLASHTYGCRVIQRMLEFGTEADRIEIMTEFHTSAQLLITDQYGNYVAQHVIQNGKDEDRSRIIQLVMAQFLTLSKHKFASNVVEKCIERGSPEQRSNAKELLTTPGSDGTTALPLMMRDQYGNYVVQKLLTHLEGTEREMFVEEIKPHFFLLKKNGASKQLQALEKLLGLNGTTSSASKTDGTSSTIPDSSSAAPTPVLTNETNSPQSSSPPSTHVSALDTPVVNTGKGGVDIGATGINPRVRSEDA
ncbi:armadillo-type protein [Stachybotrys elegans]|uniref:Pumilio homology domain family member 3 n=1 Tax=Stachybotrys elegans TaxID=80388 RepID=A0A8K0WWE8_9HYPO|nr:armadillo-type protein [Stachybotrys elegans]